MKDAYGNEYELYRGQIYIEKDKDYGNIAAYMPNLKDNNGLYVIYRTWLTKENIENAVVSMGWSLRDWT